MTKFKEEIEKCLEQNFHPYLPIENDIQAIEYDTDKLIKELYKLFQDMQKRLN